MPRRPRNSAKPPTRSSPSSARAPPKLPTRRSIRSPKRSKPTATSKAARRSAAWCCGPRRLSLQRRRAEAGRDFDLARLVEDLAGIEDLEKVDDLAVLEAVALRGLRLHDLAARALAARVGQHPERVALAAHLD